MTRLTNRFGRHAYVIGMTGVGKSYLLEYWILRLIQEGSGVAFFDPNGDTYDSLLSRLAGMPERIWERVVIIDPLELAYSVTLDPLHSDAHFPPQVRANFLATVLSKMFKVDQDVTTRMQNIMRHTFQLLIECDLPLTATQRVLADGLYREALLKRFPATHELNLFWKGELPQDWNRLREWIQSTTNRLNPFLSHPAMKAMFQGGDRPLRFRELMDQRAIILVKAAKGILGENSSKLLCAFLLAQFQLAAFSRADTPASMRGQYTLICDEFVDYATEDIDTILSQGRKYGLGMVLAHQNLTQFEGAERLREAVLNNAELLMAFRIGAADAERLSKDLFTPRIDQAKDIRSRLEPTGIKIWPYQRIEEVVWRPLQEVLHHETRRLQLLPQRHYWLKKRGPTKAVLYVTPELPSVPRTTRLEERIAALKAVSYGRYGWPRTLLDNLGSDAHYTDAGIVPDIEPPENT